MPGAEKRRARMHTGQAEVTAASALWVKPTTGSPVVLGGWSLNLVACH